MDTPLLSSTYADYDTDSSDATTAKRARKNHTVLIARNRRSQVKSKKRRRSGDSGIVGITHRRQRRWSW